MKPSVLFWFYKYPGLCENRLAVLRKFNPDAKVYGLYGGDLAEVQSFRERLGSYLDDFYVFDQPRDTRWKWYHGDQIIVHWFRQRGRHLAWDTIFVAQWDMLVFDRLERLFKHLRPGEMLFSGLRPVREVDAWWWFMRKGSTEREEYFRFIKFVRQTHAFQADPLCGEFIVVCFPREFLDRYTTIQNPDLGFLEYKIPIYAQIYGIPFCTNHPYNPWWGDDPSTQKAPLLAQALNAERKNVPLRSITAHLIWPWGRRIFHPVFHDYPLNRSQRLRRIILELRDDALRPWWWHFSKRYLHLD